MSLAVNGIGKINQKISIIQRKSCHANSWQSLDYFVHKFKQIENSRLLKLAIAVYYIDLLILIRLNPIS